MTDEELFTRIAELTSELKALRCEKKKRNAINPIRCVKADAIAMRQYEIRRERGARIDALRGEGKRWKEVAKEIGLSYDRVRQIHRRYEAENRHGLDRPYLPSERSRDRKAGRWGEGW